MSINDLIADTHIIEKSIWRYLDISKFEQYTREGEDYILTDDKLEESLKFIKNGISFHKLLSLDDTKENYFIFLNSICFWRKTNRSADNELCIHIEPLYVTYIKNEFKDKIKFKHVEYKEDKPKNEMGCHVDLLETNNNKDMRKKVRELLRCCCNIK